MSLEATDLPPELMNQAATWLSIINRPDATRKEKDQFCVWVKQSRQHARAFLQFEAFSRASMARSISGRVVL